MTPNLQSTCAASVVDDQRIAQILDEYLQGLERGASAAPEELFARHPDVADRLRGYLHGLDLFHQVISPTQMVSVTSGDHGHELRGQLGDFRLRREIGRGGMGVVYESVQVSLGRRVALKVLPFSAAIDPKYIMRFKNEAQAAAQINHPHIVPVFAIGQQRGIHYYAMQLIDGPSLSDLIEKLRDEAGRTAPTPDARPCSLRTTHTLDHVREIARMGVQAAEALHAAHEIGVVHRDVKPSNLLIDQRGKVWVTDFGVARCKTSPHITETGLPLGTISYMSPEQACGDHSRVDHRSDIYSLGVTLYELATLRHPFEGASDAALASKMSRPDWRPPRYWNKLIPRDFENILLKAMSDGREDRYASARELAEDLQRFIDCKSIQARRPTITSRVYKWAWRHRRPVATAMGVLILAVCGLATALVIIAGERADKAQAYQTAAANHRRAEQNYQQAQAKLRQARELLDRFGSQVAQGLANVPGAEGLRRELLAEMLPYFREFARETANDPSLDADLALTFSKIGYLSDQLGLQSEAEEAYDQAHTVLMRLVRTQPSQPAHLRSLAICCNNLGQLLQKRGNQATARQHLERALVIQRRLLADAPASLEYQSDLATTFGNLGLLLNQSGDAAAEVHFRAAIRIQESIRQAVPDDEDNLNHLASSYSNLSSLFIQSQPDLARQWIEKGMALQLSLAKDHPRERDYQSDLALSYNNLGAIFSRLRQWTPAQQCFSDAVALQQRLVAAAPLITVYRRDLAVSYNNLGMTQSSADLLDAAQESFQKALAIQQELVIAHRQDVTFASGLAGIYNNLGMAHQSRGQWTDADAAFQRAISHQRQAYDRAPAVLYFREALSKHYYNHAAVLRSLGRPVDAAAATLARRQLWPDDAQRLLRIAEELATICKQIPEGKARQRFITETAATLTQARDAGLEKMPDLKVSPFDVLSGQPEIAARAKRAGGD